MTRIYQTLIITLVIAITVPMHVRAQEDLPVDEGSEQVLDTAVSAKQKLDENQRILTDQQKELDELEKKITDLAGKKQTANDHATLAADQVKWLTVQLRKAEIELEQTLLSITATEDEMEQIENELAHLEKDIEDGKQQMKQILRELYEHDQVSFIDVLLGSQTLGEFMIEREVYQHLQQQALTLTKELKQRQEERQNQQQKLENQQRGLQQLKEAQGYQQVEIAGRRQAKEQLATQKQQEQAQYSSELAVAKQAREEIKQQIFSLKGVGVELALDDAFEAARFAGSVTGVRPALLLAVLKVETNVGENLGSGVFPDDMHPQSRDAFIRITSKLGLDQKATPISRRPRSYSGWGGAMGPGQFMPATWEGIESRVATLMGKATANPYELADALVGTGIMLADRGATTSNREFEAVGRYLAGPNWQYHPWYGNRVLAVAAEYEKENL